MHVGLRLVSLIATALLPPGAFAARSLDVSVSVVPASGVCGATVQPSSINVACGRSPIIPVMAPVQVAGGFRPSVASAAFGPTTSPFLELLAQPARAGMTDAGARSPFEPGSTSPADAPPDVFFRSPDDEPGYRHVGEIPATAARSMALYSAGVNISSWRMVSTDNVQHVELTLSW